MEKEKPRTLLFVNITKLEVGSNHKNIVLQRRKYQRWEEEVRWSRRRSWRWGWFFRRRNHRSIRSWRRDRSRHCFALKTNPYNIWSLKPKTCVSDHWWLSVSKMYRERNVYKKATAREYLQSQRIYSLAPFSYRIGSKLSFSWCHSVLVEHPAPCKLNWINGLRLIKEYHLIESFFTFTWHVILFDKY